LNNIRGDNPKLFCVSQSKGFIDLGPKLLSRNTGNTLLLTALQPPNCLFHDREILKAMTFGQRWGIHDLERDIELHEGLRDQG
jgi:hypothetical protein